MKKLPATLLLLFFVSQVAPAAGSETAAAAGAAAQREYLRGTLLEKHGAVAEALAAYEKALAYDPSSTFIGAQAAELALESGELDKALIWAEQGSRLQPKNAAAFVLLGRVLWARGDEDKAEKAFREALRLDPSSAESIFSLGSLLAAKDPARARALLEGFLKENPAQAAEAHFQLAKIDLQAGRLKEAEERLKLSIAADPGGEALAPRYALAQAYEAERSTDSALAAYLEVKKLDSQNVALLDHIGELYALKDDWDQARENFLAAKTARKDDPAANHWLAVDAERNGDFSAAAEFLRASAALGQDPELSLRLSYCLTQAGRLEDAVGALEAARARWPANDQIAYFLAVGYDDLGKDDKAIALLRKIVELKPDYREARYQLGALLEKTGRMAEAEKEFRALLARSPDDASLLNYLGYSLADRGLKLPEAQDLIARAAALDPSNGAYADSLGWVHFKLGRSSEAVVELERARSMLPEDETVWDHLGDAYAAVGRKADAWTAWKRSESLTPKGGRLAGKAARLESGFSPGEAGELYRSYLAGVQGGLRKVTGLCEIKGEVNGSRFSFQGLLKEEGGALDIDVLGPMFAPLLRIHSAAGDFSMDPVRIEGVPPEAARAAAATAFGALRDYLSGRYFDMKPAVLKRGWRRRRLEVPGWRVELDRGAVLAAAFEPQPGEGWRLEVDDFSRYRGRTVPRRLAVVGRGFSLAIEFQNVKIETAEPGR